MFKFSLQPVLDYRQAVEETRQRELASVLDVISRLEQEKGRLLTGLDENREKVREALVLGRSYAHRQLFESWMNWADFRISKLEGEIKVRAVEAEKRRRALAEAAKARTIIDKLRGTEKKRYQSELDHKEQQMFDEIALREFNSQRRDKKENFSGAKERISQ